jgi:hypothetical protein
MGERATQGGQETIPRVASNGEDADAKSAPASTAALMAGTTWAERYPETYSDAELDRLMTQPGRVLVDLASKPVDAAQKELWLALSDMSVPTEQGRVILRRLLAMARTCWLELYPNEKAFLTRAYEENPAPLVMPAVCLTGLSGTGKTVLLRALRLALAEPFLLPVPNHSTFELCGGWHIEAISGSRFSHLIRPLLERCESQPKGRDHVKAARHQLALLATVLLSADELQFITTGAQSSALVSQILMQLSLLGPPLVYATNYSLMHRLMKRPQEEKERILVDPIIIHPDGFGSVDWSVSLRESLKVASEFSELVGDPKASDKLYCYSYGIKRLRASLLCLAYRVMRNRNARKVTVDDLENAYLSLAFSSSRKDVEKLMAGDFQRNSKNADLWCPLEGNDVPTAYQKTANLRQAEADAKKLSEAAVRSAASADERQALNAIAERSPPPAKPERAKRPQVTEQSLLDNGRAFAQLVKARPPKKAVGRAR